LEIVEKLQKKPLFELISVVEKKLKTTTLLACGKNFEVKKPHEMIEEFLGFS